MTNIVEFPKVAKKKIAYRPAIKIDAEQIKAITPSKSTIKNVFKFVWLCVRLPLFFIMYWLRLPVMFVCKIISVPSLFAWLIAMVVIPDRTSTIWGIAAISLTFFIIEWTYDYFLMMLSPQEMIRTL